MKQYSDRNKFWEKKRFWLANLLDRSNLFCWADLAMFAMGNGLKYLFKAGAKGCKNESKTHQCETCYCGKFYLGRLSKTEDFPSEPIEGDDLPF